MASDFRSLAFPTDIPSGALGGHGDTLALMGNQPMGINFESTEYPSVETLEAFLGMFSPDTQAEFHDRVQAMQGEVGIMGEFQHHETHYVGAITFVPAS